MLVPADWTFSGGIQWVLDCPAMPATGAFQVTAPDGLAAFQAFPNRMFTWNTDPNSQRFFPRGARYFGTEVQPPTNAEGYIRQFLLPRFRGDLADLRVADLKPLPELAQAMKPQQQANPYAQTTTDAAKACLEYTRGGQQIEEEVYVVVQSVQWPMQSMFGVIQHHIWLPDHQFSFRAARGQLDANRKLFETMAKSFKVNPQWFAKYNQLVQALARQQIQRIRQVGEISRIVSQTANEISDMMNETYNERQRVNDKIATDFSRYIRGVEPYTDPNTGKEVELPSGYKNAWVSSSGEYVVSDDAGYDPAQGGGVWKKMDR
jgi:hypothetical protein